MGHGSNKAMGKSSIFSGSGSKQGLSKKLGVTFYGEKDMSYPGGVPGPGKVTDPDPKATENLKEVTVYGSKSKVGANDQKVLDELKDSGRESKSIEAATDTYGGKIVQQHIEASGADTSLYNKTRAYESAGPAQVKPSPSDTIYKHNGNKISKLDFNSIIKSNQSTIKSTQKHNDSVSARASEVGKMFPMESSSMKDIKMSHRLQKDINKGKKSLKEGITTGSFTRSVKGKEIDRRSFSTI